MLVEIVPKNLRTKKINQSFSKIKLRIMLILFLNNVVNIFYCIKESLLLYNALCL